MSRRFYFTDRVVEGGDPNARRSQPTIAARSKHATPWTCLGDGCDWPAVEGGWCVGCNPDRSRR